ncbi:LytTR family DNA-binding domain-containing protein [Bengtsoniella intestinalis]|uniref:LytR/AlgR family response regulator transcription factor n=1 Tax=Bengtsoniella intestinalis TaxID=3073143 RepID=UPI00391F4B03
MLKIAYCDDMKKDRDSIMISLGQIEDKWGEEFEITSFSSGESLCDSIAKNHYDIILLDILMNGINGIETATRIRAMGEESLIIFISSYDERVKELFKLGTIGFLDKPLQTGQLEEALLHASSILKKDESVYFTFNKNGSTQHISIKDIIYFENYKNEVILHTLKEDMRFYDSMKSVWEKLQSSDRFIMPHRAFIFNLGYVSIWIDKVTLKTTGVTYNIGNKYSGDTQIRHMKFLEKRCR